MQIEIWDVGHGACAVLTYPNGTRIMVDAGMRLDPFWSPSMEYYGHKMDLLLLQNLDEDHVQNLHWVLQNISFKALRSNPTVDAQALAQMKWDSGMGPGVKAARDLLASCGPFFGPKLDLGRTGWAHYWWNRYGTDFKDTNNLSLVAFFGYGAFTIMLTGDIERSGWLALLRIPAFRDMLQTVNVLVASHHGRDNGCCEDVFKYCRPDVVVMSDYEHRYDTQQTVDWYRCRTKGIVDNTVAWMGGRRQHRHVLTTRHDGTIRIMAMPDGLFSATGERLAAATSWSAIPTSPLAALAIG